jgi:hypothetical protein
MCCEVQKFSEIKNCSVFGLRLGMTFEEAKQIIEPSGYFPEKTSLTKLKGCHSDNEACVGYVFVTKVGLSIGLEFYSSFEDDETQLSVARIALWFDAGANPHFDPSSFRQPLSRYLAVGSELKDQMRFGAIRGAQHRRLCV